MVKKVRKHHKAIQCGRKVERRILRKRPFWRTLFKNKQTSTSSSLLGHHSSGGRSKLRRFPISRIVRLLRSTRRFGNLNLPREKGLARIASIVPIGQVPSSLSERLVKLSKNPVCPHQIYREIVKEPNQCCVDMGDHGRCTNPTVDCKVVRNVMGMVGRYNVPLRMHREATHPWVCQGHEKILHDLIRKDWEVQAGQQIAFYSEPNRPAVGFGYSQFQFKFVIPMPMPKFLDQSVAMPPPPPIQPVTVTQKQTHAAVRSGSGSGPSLSEEELLYRKLLKMSHSRNGGDRMAVKTELLKFLARQNCCLIGSRGGTCTNPATLAAICDPIPKLMGEYKIPLFMDPQATHSFICLPHKVYIYEYIQAGLVERGLCFQPGMKLPDDVCTALSILKGLLGDNNDASLERYLPAIMKHKFGFPSLYGTKAAKTQNERFPSVAASLSRLRLATLRKYKKTYKLSTPYNTKPKLSADVRKHFQKIPVRSKESDLIIRFVRKVKSERATGQSQVAPVPTPGILFGFPNAKSLAQ